MCSFSVAYVPRMLVVAEEPEVRNFIDDVLSSDGYLVTAVATGSRALDLLGETEYQTVLVDLGLVGWEGFQPDSPNSLPESRCQDGRASAVRS